MSNGEWLLLKKLSENSLDTLEKKWYTTAVV